MDIKSNRASRPLTNLKRKLIENEGFGQLYDKIVQLKIEPSDEKYQKG
jgi:hypothetical protein